MEICFLGLEAEELILESESKSGEGSEGERSSRHSDLIHFLSAARKSAIQSWRYANSQSLQACSAEILWGEDRTGLEWKGQKAVQKV